MSCIVSDSPGSRVGIRDPGAEPPHSAVPLSPGLLAICCQGGSGGSAQLGSGAGGNQTRLTVHLEPRS